jgi:phage tail sheath protein FI
MPSYLSPGVYIEEIDRGNKPIEAAGTSVAAFIGFTQKRPAGNRGEPVLVTNWTQFTDSFGGFAPGAFLPMSVYGYFLNGGGICFVQSIMAMDESAPSGNSNAPATLPRAVAQLPGKGDGAPPSLEAQSQVPGSVSLTVSDASSGAEDQFKLTAQGPGGVKEEFDNLTLSKAKGSRNAVEVVNKESKLVKLQEIESAAAIADRRPAAGSYALTAPQPQVQTTALVSTGTFTGDVTARVGLEGLEAVDEITMVCVPDLMSSYMAGKLTRDDVKAVQLAVMAHCERMRDRVAILDPMPDMKPKEVDDWRMKEANYDSQYAALYYPWIVVANPLANGKGPSKIKIPPSGHMAGVYARVDGERGVHKAPANEIVRGVLELETQVTKGEQDILNPHGINCIRAFPGRGIRIWGARTLSSDAAWRYINVRRLFCMVEESIFTGTQWVVFEPNDYALWAKVRRDIGAFLKRQWMDGALFGATPEQAYFVKCDEELNPQEVRDAGQLIIEVGMSPVKPAEFVIIRFSQMSGGEG